MKELKNITLAIADCSSVPQAIHSIKRSLSQVQPERVILFTSLDIPSTDEYEVIQIEQLKSKEDYSRWIIRELYKHITTDYIWVAQWDSWCLDGSAWTDEFLSVDYIGSSWLETDGFAVGNGGASIRSRRLMEVVATDPIIVSTHPEDNQICKVYRPYLEAKYGFKWASVELADKWGFELKAPTQNSFTFHSFFHKPFKKVIRVIRRDAMGDVIQVEPILEYFHKKGYTVVLDTLPQFYGLFYAHYFKVHHPDEIDARVLREAQVIDLTMAYENTPKRLHLASYYEMAGITNGEIKNPKLSLPFDPKLSEAKLFEKYIILHIDKRQKGRSIFGVDWNSIVDWLYQNGYTTIQIGHGEHDKVAKAVEMKNMNEPMLMRLIGGANAMIAIDSGPANIALAFDVPLIVFAGSVDMNYIYPDKTNVLVIEQRGVCRSEKCWHSVIGTEGIKCVEIEGSIRYTKQGMQGVDDCVETDEIPPCVNFDNKMVQAQIKSFFDDRNL